MWNTEKASEGGQKGTLAQNKEQNEIAEVILLNAVPAWNSRTAGKR